MNRNMLRRLLATAFMLVAAISWTSTSALAQDYGVGETVIVPRTTTGSIAIDGVYEADVWDTGAYFDLLANSAWWRDDFPMPDDMVADARALFVNDSLYIFVTIAGDELYFHEEGYGGDHILIGIDPIHEAGTTDQLVDQDDWAGWPDNAPDQGPYAYTIFGGENGGIKLWWGFAGTDPVAEGWADGVIWEDPDNLQWGVEAVFYVPGLEPGAEIGFNIGGASATPESFDVVGEPHAFFSRWSVENPGGDIQSLTSSYATLRMAGGASEGYGGGVVLQVPHVEPGSITIDGMDDEAAWAQAQSDIDVTAHWNPYGAVGEENPTPDLFGETKLLWSEDTLYIHHRLFDPVIFHQESDFWGSDMILIGIDNSLEGDSLFGPDFDGGVANAPEGVYTYFINPIAGFTFAWNEEVVPSDTGWVRSVVYVDEASGEWGLEAAIYVPAIELGGQIGFDIGGAQASEEQCSEGFCDYAYFAWQSGAEGTDPGAINRDATYWATLLMVETVAIEKIDEVPQHFALKQNYPNPFNPATTIEFATMRAGHVTLEVVNMLGQTVATLVDEPQAVGTYRVSWNAAGFTSGMYVYQLRIDNEVVDTKKMMLIK